MNVRQLAVLACIALGASACKKARQEPAAPAATPAEVKPSAPAPATAPAAPVTPRPDFPATDSTLSVLLPTSGRCEWTKLDPLGEQRVIASLEGNCVGGEVALSRDGARGLIRFDPQALRGSTVGKPAFPSELLPGPAKDRLFEVDVAAGTVRELPLPNAGELVDFGFDSKGRRIAVLLRRPTPNETRVGVLVVDETEVALEGAAGEGTLAVALAFAYEDGAWKRVELKVTSEGGERSPGVRVLKTVRDLGFRSTEALDPHVRTAHETRNKVLDGLRAFAPQVTETEGSWIRLAYGGHSAVVWEANGEPAFTTGLLAFIEKNAPVKPAQYPYTEGDVVALRTRGQYLLVAQDVVGAHPRLYRGAQLVWTSDTARATTLWPK